MNIINRVSLGMHWRQGMFKVPPPLSLLVETTFFCSYYLIVIMATKTINCCFPQPTVPWPGLALYYEQGLIQTHKERHCSGGLQQLL